MRRCCCVSPEALEVPRRMSRPPLESSVESRGLGEPEQNGDLEDHGSGIGQIPDCETAACLIEELLVVRRAASDVDRIVVGFDGSFSELLAKRAASAGSAGEAGRGRPASVLSIM